MIPQRFIYRSLLFLVFVAAVVGALHQVIWAAFQHNPWLNGVILAILLLGIFLNIRRILRLRPEASWIEAVRRPMLMDCTRARRELRWMPHHDARETLRETIEAVRARG